MTTFRVSGARTAAAAALFTALVLMMSFVARSAVAAPVVVDGTPTVVGNAVTSCIGTASPYPTIQSGVSAAPAGSTVQVCPGNYPEQVTIAKALTLKGVSGTSDNSDAAVVTVPSTFTTGQLTQVDIQASGVTLANIGVDGTNTLSSCGLVLVGILFDTGSSGTLKQVTLRNHNIPNPSGGYCGNGFPIYATTAVNATVTDSSVRNFDGIGIDLTTSASVIVKTTTVAPVYVMSPLGSIPNCVYANAPTVQVSSNTVGSCGTGVEVTTPASGSGTVSNNTIVGWGTSSTGFGFLCFPSCYGITVSGNQIFNTQAGAAMKTSGATGSIVFENNSVNGTLKAFDLYGQPNNTVSNNTITDAAVGISGVAGNTVTGNTFKTVTVLTQ
jgi:parallel beta-helix repeat protein